MTGFLSFCEWGVGTAGLVTGILASPECGELDDADFFRLLGDPGHPDAQRAAELGY